MTRIVERIRSFMRRGDSSPSPTKRPTDSETPSNPLTSSGSSDLPKLPFVRTPAAPPRATRRAVGMLRAVTASLLGLLSVMVLGGVIIWGLSGPPAPGTTATTATPSATASAATRSAPSKNVVQQKAEQILYLLKTGADLATVQTAIDQLRLAWQCPVGWASRVAPNMKKARAEVRATREKFEAERPDGTTSPYVWGVAYTPYEGKVGWFVLVTVCG